MPIGADGVGVLSGVLLMFEFKPTYTATFKSSLNTRLQLIALQTAAVLLMGFSVGVPDRIVRLITGSTALTLAGVSMVTRREYLKQLWELDLHQQLSNAEFQRQLLNSYNSNDD